MLKSISCATAACSHSVCRLPRVICWRELQTDATSADQKLCKLPWFPLHKICFFTFVEKFGYCLEYSFAEWGREGNPLSICHTFLKLWDFLFSLVCKLFVSVYILHQIQINYIWSITLCNRVYCRNGQRSMHWSALSMISTTCAHCWSWWLTRLWSLGIGSGSWKWLSTRLS